MHTNTHNTPLVVNLVTGPGTANGEPSGRFLNIPSSLKLYGW